MSTLPHSFWFNHLTDIEAVTWRPIDFDAAKIKNGLKKKPFKGYVEWRVGGQLRRFTSENVEQLIEKVMKFVGRKAAEAIAGEVSIVPIPNGEMALGATGSFRIIELASMMVGSFEGRANVVDAIRWNKPRATKQHEVKGWRSPDMFQPLMRLAKRPKRPIVIFDDVLTSGSQSIAAVRFLRENDLEPVHIVTVAKAGKTQFPEPFGWQTEQLEIEHCGIDFDDF